MADKPDPKEARRAAEKKLKEAKDRAARRKMGPSVKWSDQDLDDLAEVRPSDIQSAKAFWRKHAPPKFRFLLDATEDKGTADAD